jgi:hypothetical protein
MAGTPYVGSDNRPLASGVNARATSALASRSSWSVPSRPTAVNIRRSVLRWSIATMANVPPSAAMSSRLFV